MSELRCVRAAAHIFFFLFIKCLITNFYDYNTLFYDKKNAHSANANLYLGWARIFMKNNRK